MRNSKFTGSQIVATLKQAEGDTPRNVQNQLLEKLCNVGVPAVG
jgi:hypothetical protein